MTSLGTSFDDLMKVELLLNYTLDVFSKHTAIICCVFPMTEICDCYKLLLMSLVVFVDVGLNLKLLMKPLLIEKVERLVGYML